MSPDEDAQLRSAFAELRRRNEADAPPFESMREKAIHVANASDAGEASLTNLRSFSILRLAGWSTAACAVVVSIWIFSGVGGRHNSNQSSTHSPAPVDQIITRIEEHVDYHAAIALPEYPSDVLLTTSNVDSSL